MKVIQTELKGYNRRQDSTVSLKCDSLIELSSNDIAEIDGHRGDVAIVVLTDSIIGNEVKIDIDDILKNLPENDAIDNYKSPSKRLKGALYLNYKQELGREPTKEEFADYYKTKMDKVIKHYTDKLDDIN